MPQTQAGNKVFICTTAQNADLADAAAFTALTFVEVKEVGRIGEFGISTNMVTYNTLATSVAQKGKGVTDLGSPEVECSRNITDAGQVAMRTAGSPTNQNAFALKVERSDTPTSGASPKPTRHFIRAVVSGPTRPNGGVEDFDLEVFTLGILQIIDAPASAT